MDESAEHLHPEADLDRDTGLCVREPQDLLGYIPHAFGDWPRESLVAITLGAGSIGVAVRVDLPADRQPADLKHFADTVCDYLTTDPLADSVVFAVYTAEEWDDIVAPPHAEVVTTTRHALAKLGLPLLDAWLVGKRTWRSMLCLQVECCRWPGETIATITESRVSAEFVFRGSFFGGPDDSVSDGGLAPGGRAPHAQAPEAAARHAERRALPAELADSELADCPAIWWERGAFAAALAVWEEALSGGRAPDDARLDLLGASLGRPALRDAVIVAAALGGAAGWRGSEAVGALGNDPSCAPPPAFPGGLSPEAVCCAVDRWEAGESDEEASIDAALDFSRVILGRTAARPEWDRIGRLERIVALLIQKEEPEIRAPALAVLGWIFWVRGRGSKASGHLRRALSASPGYRFADLLLRVVEGGELAGWARRPETAWRRAGEAA